MHRDDANQRFERPVGEDVVFAAFRKADGRLLITHVEAPRHLRGTGEAARLMQEIVDHVRQTGEKITPLCGYAAVWFRRHPQEADVLA